MNYDLPDLDDLVTSALRAGMPGVNVRVLWDGDVRALTPTVMARRVAGAGAADPRGIDVGTVIVTSAAETRREANALARTANAVLAAACRAQHAGDSGYLTRLVVISGPAELRTGDPAPGPDLHIFQATIRVTARASR